MQSEKATEGGSSSAGGATAPPPVQEPPEQTAPASTDDDRAAAAAAKEEEAGGGTVAANVPELENEGGVGSVGGAAALVWGLRKKAEITSNRLKEKKDAFKELRREKTEKLMGLSEHRRANRDSTGNIFDVKMGGMRAKPTNEGSEEVGEGFSKESAPLEDRDRQKDEKALPAMNEDEGNSDENDDESEPPPPPPSTPGLSLAEAANKASPAPVKTVEKVVAVNKDVAQKAVGATKKAAEDARRGAEETANFLKAAFRTKKDESGLQGDTQGQAADSDDSLEVNKRDTKMSREEKDGEDAPLLGPSSDVSARKRDLLAAPVKAGVAVVKTVEKKLSKGYLKKKNSMELESADSGLSSEAKKTQKTDAAALSRQDISVSKEQESESIEAPTTPVKNSTEAVEPRFAQLSRDTLVVGPFLEFIVRDSTIIIAMAVLTGWWTYKSIPMIINSGAIPLKTALSWTMLGFLSGFHWTLLTSGVPLFTSSVRDAGSLSLDQSTSEAENAAVIDFVGKLPPSTIDPHTAHDDDNHKLFRHTLRRVTAIQRVSYLNRGVADHGVKSPLAPLIPESFWTCLHDTAGREKLPWEHSVARCIENDALHMQLLTFSDFRLRRKGSVWSGGSMTANSKETPTEMRGMDAENGVSSVDQNDQSAQPFGEVRMRNKSKVETLAGDFEIDPLCRLRGMDVFQTDCPEEEVYRHRLLTGMRKVPTLVINIMVPWANILVYFQLPDWVKRFDDIEESSKDSEDTKALKRFLTAEDEYRNPRLFIIPSLVDAPLPIRMMAPAKKEITISCRSVPVKWYFQNETTGSDGSMRAALVEADLDLVTAKSVRKVASMVRPQTARITIDCALVISKPKDSENDEPSACLGMWRMEKVDLNGCAVLPPKTESEMVQEATVIMSTLQEEGPEEIAVAAG